MHTRKDKIMFNPDRDAIQREADSVPMISPTAGAYQSLTRAEMKIVQDFGKLEMSVREDLSELDNNDPECAIGHISQMRRLSRQLLA